MTWGYVTADILRPLPEEFVSTGPPLVLGFTDGHSVNLIPVL